jgi:hypothetical protein
MFAVDLANGNFYDCYGGSWSEVAGSGSGTVTSAGMSITGGILSVSGSPITTSGTLAVTVAGTSGGIPCFTSASTWASSLLLTANVLTKGGGSGTCPTNSSVTDNGTTVTSIDTGGYVAPVFVADGTTAGFVDFPQGSTSASVAPCNTANSICHQAPTSVTSYVVTEPGAAPTLSGSLKSTTTGGVESYVHTIPANTDPNGGIYDFSSSSLTPGGNAGTYYYLSPSALTMPATYSTAIGAGTTMQWHFEMSKTAAGTAAFNIRFYYGTNGSTSDTTLATQSVGTATAALDDMTCDALLAFTSATAAYWTLTCQHSAATAVGFGLAIGSQEFSGTLTGLTTTTASLIFGLGYSNTTGTAVITVPLVEALAYGVN